MPRSIDDGSLPDWRALQDAVARILSEAGFDVDVEFPVQTVRGTVNVDVRAIDTSTTPRTALFCECKHWGNNVPQTVVHAFRTVVQDAGATSGLLIATSGFQSGAHEAATMSNVFVQTWADFQDMFAERWWANYGAKELYRVIDPLVEYTEWINGRVFRKADALPLDRREEFKRLRSRHAGLGLGLLPAIHAVPGYTEKPIVPSLPMRRGLALDQVFEGNFPEAVLTAASLRGFLEAVTVAARAAIAEFDAVFGERA